GAYLERLLEQYLEVVDEEEGRLRRDLERMRDSVIESKKGGRANSLSSVLRELNTLVHLEVSTVADLLSLVVAHEYDKWGQRQLLDISADARRSKLPETSWTS
ncbi:MAG: hypothetical protein GWN58_62205, partial [Anaerolineae bacterium]|nr:hypothetical protein [Anaerolineae bacterium]